MKRVIDSLWVVVLGFVIFDVMSLVCFTGGSKNDYVTGFVGYMFASNQLDLLGNYAFILPLVIVIISMFAQRASRSNSVNVKRYSAIVFAFMMFSLSIMTLGSFFESLIAPWGYSSLIGKSISVPLETYVGIVGGVVIGIVVLLLTASYFYSVIKASFVSRSMSVAKPKENKGTTKHRSATKAKRDKVIVGSSKKTMPTVDLLVPGGSGKFELPKDKQLGLIGAFEAALSDFKISGSVKDVVSGPVVTRLIVDLAPGVKVTSVMNVSNDIARSLKVESIRVVDVIAGTSSIGIEVPNENREMVRFSQVIESKSFRETKSLLPIAIGFDVVGSPCVFDLAKAPHLLVAGTTGSGKSVGVNAMIMSLLFSKTPEELRFIMIDPKMLELSVYSGIPHLYSDVITNMSEAHDALKWCVGEMERRYELMSKYGVRNVASFNERVREANSAGEKLYQLDGSTEVEALPSIVVVIDEFADLIMSVGKKIEENICRLAQKSRAAGIHLVLATQRPSVDVITGLIKSNIPSRMSFQVSSKIDSRTVLDQGGAEQLLGMGDMLISFGGSSKLERVHGAFIDDSEVSNVAGFLKSCGIPDYIELTPNLTTNGGASALGVDESDMEAYQSAISLLENGKTASISSIQRHLKIGYNRAARIVENLEENGVLVLDEKGNRIARLP